MAGGYYSADVHGPYELINIGELELANGDALPDCKLAVATFGELNENRDNAILIPTWYSGSHKILADAYIGKDRALSPERYFIIVANQIGGGLSTSPNNYGGSPEAFPEIAILDDANAQAKLVTGHFDIDRLALVCGGSMGGQQAITLAAHYPEQVARVAAFASAPVASGYLTTALRAMLDTLDGIDSLRRSALSAHARLWAVLGLSSRFYAEQAYALLGFGSAHEFVDGFLDPYFAPMDPHVLRLMARKAMNSNLGTSDREEQLNRLKNLEMPVDLLSVDTDAVFPPSDVRGFEEQIPGARYSVLTSLQGHLALFGADPAFLAQLDGKLTALLEEPV